MLNLDVCVALGLNSLVCVGGLAIYPPPPHFNTSSISQQQRPHCRADVGHAFWINLWNPAAAQRHLVCSDRAGWLGFSPCAHIPDDGNCLMIGYRVWPCNELLKFGRKVIEYLSCAGAQLAVTCAPAKIHANWGKKIPTRNADLRLIACWLSVPIFKYGSVSGKQLK